jgi:glucan phosphoethanolaminetransferase (alkaline phosphatase superfamily)
MKYLFLFLLIIGIIPSMIFGWKICTTTDKNNMVLFVLSISYSCVILAYCIYAKAMKNVFTKEN